MTTKISWIRIYDFSKHGNEPQLPDTLRSIDIEGKRICLAYYSGTYYAADDRCPHAGARLGAGGWCEDGMLVCPVHRHRFDLTTGRGTKGDYLQTYPVEKRQDGVYVGFERKRNWWWPF